MDHGLGGKIGDRSIVAMIKIDLAPYLNYPHTMDNLPFELFQRIARFCGNKEDLSSFSATCTLALASVRPVLFESIQIVATRAGYTKTLGLSNSDLASLVRFVSFHFYPKCNLSLWHPLLILFTHMRRILLSTITDQLEQDRVQGFRDLLAGLSSLSTIRTLHVYGGNMPDVKDVQFQSLDCIHLLECSFPGTGKLPWHERAKRAVAWHGVACQREKRASMG